MYLIFDFDGTLVDSFASVMEEFNLLADEFNFRTVNLDEVPKLKNLSSVELIKYLHIPLHEVPMVLHRARQAMQEKMGTLTPFAGIPETLHDFFNANIPLGIVTSNSEDNVTSWLKHNKIEQYFNFIHTESNYFGKEKILTEIIRANKIDVNRAFYIGDETRDIEAANQCGLASIAVTWGFNSEKILSQSHPHSIARKPEDLLQIISRSSLVF